MLIHHSYKIKNKSIFIFLHKNAFKEMSKLYLKKYMIKNDNQGCH